MVPFDKKVLRNRNPSDFVFAQFRPRGLLSLNGVPIHPVRYSFLFFGLVA